MVITEPANRVTDGIPDAVRARPLRGRKAPITLTLPPDLIERFDAEAVRQEGSRAGMLAIVMREWLERQ